MALSTLVLFFLFGLVFGSFGGMCVYRIPRDLPLGLFKKSRSFCPNCNKQVAWYDNIPVFSYLFLGGKCRRCKKPISIWYPLVELLVAVSFVFVAWMYKWNSSLPLPAQAVFFVDLYFFWSLVVMTFIDLEFRIIPDRFSLGNWGVALALVAFIYFKTGVLDVFAIVGGLVGFGAFFLIGFTYEKVTKVEGLGFGDVKLMGWLCTWLGLTGLPILLLAASLTGLMVGVIVMIKEKGNLKTAIPFGPFLALGAIIVWTLQKLDTFPALFNHLSS